MSIRLDHNASNVARRPESALATNAEELKERRVSEVAFQTSALASSTMQPLSSPSAFVEATSSAQRPARAISPIHSALRSSTLVSSSSPSLLSSDKMTYTLQKARAMEFLQEILESKCSTLEEVKEAYARLKSDETDYLNKTELDLAYDAIKTAVESGIKRIHDQRETASNPMTGYRPPLLMTQLLPDDTLRRQLIEKHAKQISNQFNRPPIDLSQPHDQRETALVDDLLRNEIADEDDDWDRGTCEEIPGVIADIADQILSDMFGDLTRELNELQKKKSAR